MSNSETITRKHKINLRGYEVVKKLGSGHYGKVYLFRNTVTNEYVAVKFIKKEETLTPERKKLFDSEIYTLKSLSQNDVELNRYIVQYRELREDERYYMIIMDYAEGKTINDYIADHWDGYNSQDILDAMKLAARAVRVIHRYGFAHRDIKDSNIMLDLVPRSSSTSSLSKLKVLDFGLSCVNNDCESTYACVNRYVGTLTYMAPETIVSKQKKYEFDKTDIYSLGALFFIMTTSYHLFDHVKKNKSKLKMAKSQGDHLEIRTGSSVLNKGIAEMISQDPDDRPDIDEVIVMLAKITPCRFKIFDLR